MDANELKILLNIIDDRVTKKINETKFLKKYTGRIVKSIDSSKSVVKLAGEETEFIFPNKTGKLLNIGDNVYVETLGTDLNTGVISEKFGFDDLINTAIIKSKTVKVKVSDENTNKWQNFNFADKLNFCWRKISISSQPDAKGTITFTEILPFSFTEEPFVFLQGIENGDNFSQPISYKLISKITKTGKEGSEIQVTKFTGVNVSLHLKNNSINEYGVNIFVIGKV